MTTSRIRLVLASAVLVLVASPALAQRDEAGADSLPVFQAPPIVVTATRTPTPVDRVASSITVVTREEIERRQYRTALDALRDVPGIAVARSGGEGGVSSVFLRGAGSDQVLVLVDGVEANDPSAPSNAYDFANLLAHDIERIEVLRGPQSTLYGSNATAGVIQIFTRRGGGGRASVRGEGGSHGTWEGSASAAGGDVVRWALDLARRRTDGISFATARLGNTERDANDVLSGSSRLAWAPAPDARIALSVRGSSAETQLDQNEPRGDDPNFVTDDDELSARAEGMWTMAEGRWRQTVGVSWARIDRDTEDAVDPARPQTRSTSAFDGRRWVIDAQGVMDVAGGRLTAGVEHEVARAASTSFFDGPFGPFESRLPETSVRTTGGYVQHQATVADRLHLTAGLRADDHERFGGAVTWRIAPVVVVAEGTRLRATVGTGFKAPSLFQLFDPQFGNRELDPERSLGWDAGVEHRAAEGRVTVSATVFGNRFEDQVAFGESGFVNLAEASTRGLELAGHLLPSDRVRVTASWTYTRAVDESDGADDGLRLLRRPRHAVDATLAWAPSQGSSVAVTGRFVGERDDLDFATFPAERVTLDDHVTVRAAGSLAVADGVRAFGRVENLFDADVEEVLHFGDPGRTLHAGLELGL